MEPITHFEKLNTGTLVQVKFRLRPLFNGLYNKNSRNIVTRLVMEIIP